MRDPLRVPGHRAPAAEPESMEALFSARLADAPGAPLVTYYDVRSGERMELSTASTANWVAKTHFLLIDSVGIETADLALVDLPLHWMSVPVLLGCWTAGLGITETPGDACVAFVSAEGVRAAVAAGIPEIYALSFATWGRGFDGPPPDGAEDYVLAVRPQPDAWAGVRFPASAPDHSWAGSWGSITRPELVARGRERAAEIGLDAGGRLLIADTAPVSPADDEPLWLDTIVAPLAVGASVVMATGADAKALERIAKTEKATAILS